MEQPNRQYTPGIRYRFGFNGKENDNDVKGEGNQQDYGMRIYDPRIGKFLSIDPLTNDYPWLTPYQFTDNSPLVFIDEDGMERAYKLPDGTIYYHPPSDNLKIPIPNGARALDGDDMRAGAEDRSRNTSLILNFIPYVGFAKGVYEAYDGKDLITNEGLSLKQRLSGLVPCGLGKSKKVSISLDVAKTVSKAEKNIIKAGALAGGTTAKIQKNGRIDVTKPQLVPGRHDKLDKNGNPNPHYQMRPGDSQQSPANKEELFGGAVPDIKGKNWWAKDKEGNYHRYSGSKDGKEVHWSGSTNSGDPIKENQIPGYVKERLNKQK